MEPAAARSLLNSASFVWHQRFELASDVYTPGANDLGWLWRNAGLPTDLTGQTVLDIGTTNGGFAFEAERRGAKEVIAVDIFDPDHFGFSDIAAALESSVKFVQGSVYGLPRILGRQFDIVFFLGVLYHLRHPLLALDAVRALTSGTAFIETAVCDSRIGGGASGLVEFYRSDSLSGDSSNWFAPTSSTLVDWCESSGFTTRNVASWPEEAPERASLVGVPKSGDPEYAQVSYEIQLL